MNARPHCAVLRLHCTENLLNIPKGLPPSRSQDQWRGVSMSQPPKQKIRLRILYGLIDTSAEGLIPTFVVAVVVLTFLAGMARGLW
jgi:hypothetical protein